MTAGPAGAVFFDLFGTLLDLNGLTEACRQVAPAAGERLATTWRTRQLEISWLRTAMDAYVDFDVVTADALDAALDELGLVPDQAQLALLRGAFEELEPIPGAVAVVTALRDEGLVTGVLSNAARGSLARILTRSAMAPLFDHALSVDAVRRFKPHPYVYRLAVESTGLPADRIGFVTANGWDAVGAAAFGLRVAWLRQPGSPAAPRVGVPPPLEADWSTVVSAFS